MKASRGYAVVDVETTGLYNSDRVLEVGVVALDDDGHVVDEFETLIDPDRDVGPTEIHGITASMVSAAPRFGEVADSIASMLDGRVFVAHNVSFDARFMNNEFDRIGVGLELGDPVCTLSLTGARLNIACEERGIELSEHHRALADARATAALLKCSRRSASARPASIRGTLPVTAARTTCRPGAGVSAASDLRRVISRVRYPSERAAVLTYLDALDWALNDLVIDSVEAAALAGVAADLGINAVELERAHERYLDALIDAVERDGIVTEDEHSMLTSVARALGLATTIPDETQSPTAADVVRPGATVCFTGGATMPRADLEHIAERNGLIPKPSVTKKLDILVAADASSASGKAKKARAYGIPVLGEAEFLAAASD